MRQRRHCILRGTDSEHQLTERKVQTRWTISPCSMKQVEILDDKTKEQLCFLDKQVEYHSTVGDIKGLFHRVYPQWYPARQALKLHPKSAELRDDELLQNLPVGVTATLYFQDLGPRFGWTMVFLSEYVGPLLIYLLFYFRLPYIYTHTHILTPPGPHPVVSLACVCHSLHYIKRLMETVFVHRFTHGTLPVGVIIRNCVYYWGFAAWLAYYINHPLYTPPSYGQPQVICALVMFMLCEVGNFSIHWSLNTSGADGVKYRSFPHPSKNPFTWLFFFVSCPNYTYEVGVWVSFSVMTQCVPVAVFTLIGFVQMTIWAKWKHKAYTREFKDYPALRMSILPFIL
ncbi:very-long-chain enoyl-CoA reductase isoform X5 [Hemibagrus wyckioides]|uniref:very-long-chain enoyl-CoA reductase isoform X5 n=1 Tax=Hemibagrus wyckioides TaxID=337641 RepID=UPI00266BCF1C|nr:very-long-chain enoyl-CoA reductase isoform X5 [Hemibagrus wyckioides]